VLDALHDAPAFGIEPAAHLLAALAPQYPSRSVFLAVVDPGVGGRRDAIVARLDGRSFVAPDNGLLSILWRRAKRRACWRIAWRPARLSSSFHGRDLFAPVAAMIARGNRRQARLEKAELATRFGADNLGEIIYEDHFGNLLTGLRAAAVPRNCRLVAGRRRIPGARVFSEVRPGDAFWYENSLGLVEIAANSGSAAQALGLKVGDAVGIAGGQ
jgi:S-adenosylmethionine hydrolase